MRNRHLQKVLADQEFERRSAPHVLVHLLGLLPLLVFALLSWVHFDRLPAPAVPITCACYVSVSLLQYAIVRREILASLRREGRVDAAYRPPIF